VTPSSFRDEPSQREREESSAFAFAFHLLAPFARRSMIARARELRTPRLRAGRFDLLAGALAPLREFVLESRRILPTNVTYKHSSFVPISTRTRLTEVGMESTRFTAWRPASVIALARPAQGFGLVG